MPTVDLEDLIARTLQIGRERVVDSLGFQGIPEWDSLGHVNLMVAIDAAYGTSIDEDQMVELTNVAAIRVFVAGKNVG